jgi:hypothetical protein
MSTYSYNYNYIYTPPNQGNITVFNNYPTIDSTLLNTTLYTNINSYPTSTTSTIYSYDYNNYLPKSQLSDDSIRNIINLIPIKMNKIIPTGSTDIITYEDINDNDIIIDFKRDSKTESEHGAYYKESSFIDIFKGNKNPFTMLPLDANSIVKYRVKYE